MAVKWYSNHDWKAHAGIRRDAWIVLVDQDRIGVRPELVWDDQDSIPRCSRWAYLVPLSKVFSSMGRIRKWQAYGNIKAIWILSASKCGFPFGFPAAFVWWQKGYRGETKITTLTKGGNNE